LFPLVSTAQQQSKAGCFRSPLRVVPFTAKKRYVPLLKAAVGAKYLPVFFFRRNEGSSNQLEKQTRLT
jgi:hypothetical protein